MLVTPLAAAIWSTARRIAAEPAGAEQQDAVRVVKNADW